MGRHRHKPHRDQPRKAAPDKSRRRKHQTYGLPQTELDLRALKPFEFQNWIIQQVHGAHAPRKTGDMGIDGYSFFERLPIQIKQSDRVGRNVIDNFETAIRRTGNHKGYIFAFSFTRGAYEETARIKSEGLEIALVPIQDLLAPPPPPAVPVEPGLDMLADLQEAVRRAQQEAAGSRPERSATELIASDTGGVKPCLILGYPPALRPREPAWTDTRSVSLEAPSARP